MKRISRIIFILIFSAGISFSQSGVRQVAVTIDDLPAVSLFKDFETQRQITRDLLYKLNQYKIPAVGFVNEGKLYDDGILNEEKSALLKQWIDAGLELGNHTFSHRSLNRIPAEEYISEIIDGEVITRKLMNNAGKNLKYFRHPFLHTGRNAETREKVNKFLKDKNYIIAPVTIDNSEWIFARAYDRAVADNDTGMMNKIAGEYIRYMDNKFEHYEYVSKELFGREIRQVLLIHSNMINADHLDKLADMILKRGYKFISLEEALIDKAYDSSDSFYGAGGISWLHRWALTAGLSREIFKGDLPAPEFVKEYAGIEDD